MKLNPADMPDVVFDAPLADISVCFGFMHHVPSCEYRVRVLDALVRQTRLGGIIAISFWEFMNDERMVRKAARAEARAELAPPFEGYDPSQFEPGDHLIGWQNDHHAYRYCHHFDDQQITDLVTGVRALSTNDDAPVRELARFHADGHSGEAQSLCNLAKSLMPWRHPPNSIYAWSPSSAGAQDGEIPFAHLDLRIP